MGPPCSEVKRHFDGLFSYDPEISTNPEGTHKPSASCHVRNFGICSSDIYAREAGTFCKSLHVLLQRHGVVRADLPQWVELRLGEISSQHLLTNVIGLGQSQLLIELEAAPGEGIYKLAFRRRCLGKIAVRVSTTQMVVSRLLSTAELAAPAAELS